MLKTLKEILGESQERRTQHQRNYCLMMMMLNIEAMVNGEPCCHIASPLGFKLSTELESLERFYGAARESVIQQFKDSEFWEKASDAERKASAKVTEFMLNALTRE